MNSNDFRVLTVRFSTTKNCFVSLPSNWNLRGKQDVVILDVEDATTQVKCYVTWAGHKSVREELSINGIFGSRLGLVDGNQVIVKVSSGYTSPCIQATVTPLSSDDWEVMNYNARFVESRLIHQIRCIWNGMTFPIWTEGNVCLFVNVVSVSPDLSPVLLQEHTHVTVVPPNSQNSRSRNPSRSGSLKEQGSPRNPGIRKDVTRTSSVNQILNAFSSAVMNALSPSSPQPHNESPSFDQQRRQTEVLRHISVSVDLRVLSLQELFTDNLSLLPPTTVFVSETTFGAAGHELPGTFLCYLHKLLSPAEKMAVHKGQEDSTKTVSYKTEPEVVHVIVVRDFGRHPLPWSLKKLQAGSVAVHDLLRRQLGLEVTAKVWIQSLSHDPEISQPNIVLHPLSLQLSQSEEKLIECFRAWMSSLRMPLATSGEGTLVHFPKDGGTDLVLKVEPPEGKTGRTYWILGSHGWNVKLGQKIFTQHTLWGPSLPCKLEALVQKFKPVGPKLHELGGMGTVAQSIMEWLELNMRLSPLSQSVFAGSGAGVPCLLLCGPKGVGKTALCQAICQEVASWRGQLVHTLLLPCRNLRGKRVEGLRKIWQVELSECVYRQPSLFVLDDLDLIASAPSGPEAEAGLDTLYFSRIAQTLISIQDLLQESQVVLIATSKTMQTLHPKLSSNRGRHFFTKVVHLKPPDIDQRKDILTSLIRTKGHLSEESLRNISLTSLSAKTDGYVAQDLEMLVDRATHAAFLNETNGGSRCSNLVLRDESFDAALQDFVPSSLSGLALHSDSGKSWDDLGGLGPVKEALQQTLLWPLKYPKLFGRTALRLQSGVLLYGAPGTGKTLLAGILAAEAGINFISIKGPELLSKYIGASEQAVRDLFQRAQCAKPCILFFDEFDAIVPRRGHDNTGVTDRVVNQFLTQMDGVESLSGVYVLSASSRPDLIDPALLRPGRIDKCLYCPLPLESEREEILLCLSRRLHMDQKVDLESLARMTTHFSGADLQALLYSAQLLALQDFQKNRASVCRSDSQAALVSLDDVLYFPRLEEGVLDLEDHKDRDAVLQQMERIRECSLRSNAPGGAQSSRRRRKSSFMSPSISQAHLIQALDQAKGSVLNRDRIKFQIIYEEFQRSREGDFRPSRPQLQRATLA